MSIEQNPKSKKKECSESLLPLLYRKYLKPSFLDFFFTTYSLRNLQLFEILFPYIHSIDRLSLKIYSCFFPSRESLRYYELP